MMNNTCSQQDAWSCQGKCVVDPNTKKPMCDCEFGKLESGFFGGCSESKRRKIASADLYVTAYDGNGKSVIVKSVEAPREATFAIFKHDGTPLSLLPGTNIPFILQPMVTIYDSRMQSAEVPRSEILKAVVNAPPPFGGSIDPSRFPARVQVSSGAVAHVRSNVPMFRDAGVPHTIDHVVRHVVASKDPVKEATRALSDIRELSDDVGIPSVKLARRFLEDVVRSGARDQSRRNIAIPADLSAALKRDMDTFDSEKRKLDFSNVNVSFPFKAR